MNSTDQHLIELVKKCSHLYDKHSDYKDKIKAQNAWCSIARLLNQIVEFNRYVCVSCIYLFSLYNVL